jgi:hypothetical protein
MADHNRADNGDNLPTDSDVGDNHPPPSRAQVRVIPRWAVIALFVLLILVVASITTDSIVAVLALNKLVRIQNEFCQAHLQIRLWETYVSAHFHLQQPLLGPEPAACHK